MRISVGQIYTSPGIEFPFSLKFQSRIGAELTSLVHPSEEWTRKYNGEFNLIFRMSAKQGIVENEIKGPTIFKRAKDVEYTIFLPFDIINGDSDKCASALGYLIKGIIQVLDVSKIDTSRISDRAPAMISRICSDSSMFRS